MIMFFNTLWYVGCSQHGKTHKDTIPCSDMFTVKYCVTRNIYFSNRLTSMFILLKYVPNAIG